MDTNIPLIILNMEPVSKYLQAIKALVAKGNATEHSFRPALINLIEASAKGVKATNEPKRVKAGAPDLIVTRGQIPLGYIETKDIGKSLDEIEQSEQMKRYRKGLNNLILTDYLEFRWYEGGEKRLTIRLASISKGKIQAEKEAPETFTQLLNQFLTTEIPSAEGPKDLASRMAALGQLIRDVILKALADEDKSGSLHGQLEGFRKVLIHDLEENQFADMYAQTICYGLFAARCNHQGKGPFTRENAVMDLPETNPFLAEMFDYIAGRKLDKRLIWIVIHLAELLNRADIACILRDFNKRTRREDPVVHFYETFLTAYDPRMRKGRGVYYTPEPMVSYIVRSIDHILKIDFGLGDGLADTSKVPAYKSIEGKDGKIKREKAGECHKVLILDPAVGTGTFLHGVIDQIHDQVLRMGGKGMWSGYVSKHLLPRLFGFELLMAPYVVAHLKLGLQLKEMGYDFSSGERLKIYLTNTLEESRQIGDLTVFAGMVANEANAAGHVKSEAPVMVILGNPPYSYQSGNTGDWISNLIKDYYQCNGIPLRERNPKGLQDDYVKFIRFAQWRIEQTGYGILAFISNHGYIDNPTFRGMRQSLMKTFNRIYIIDLHGNSKKMERCPDGSKDQNVFDIEQGVAIGIFVKLPKQTGESCLIQHSDIWGVRELTENGSLVGGKYFWLFDNNIGSTNWKQLEPKAPLYMFTPLSERRNSEYQKYPRITDIMPLFSGAMNTARDKLVIDIDKNELIKRLKYLRESKESTDRILSTMDVKQTPWWNYHAALASIKTNDNWENDIIRCLHKPFDFRWLYNNPTFIDRSRKEINDNMAYPNLSLITPRQTKEDFSIMVSSLICSQHKIVTVYDRSYIFPLYIYSSLQMDALLSNANKEASMHYESSNYSKEFLKNISNKLNITSVPVSRGDLQTTFGPEDIFHYIYAVFHSPAYRKRYAEFLKIDFPRLPLTSNKELFRALCNLGEELVGLHLMEKFGPSITQYPITGDNLVEKVRYSEPGQGTPCGRVWINKNQYFENVPPDIWQFHIGGYQVCEKWLKDRKGRTLSYDDLTHYQQIVSALSETIRLMAEIDICIDKHGGWPIK
jgi:hypothetical protein